MVRFAGSAGRHLISFDRCLARLATFHTVVVYDGEQGCQVAEAVGRRLAAGGLRDVRVLEGAWGAYLAAGGPGASGACSACQHGPEAHR